MLHLAPELRAEKPLAAEPQPPASSKGLGLRAQSSCRSTLWPCSGAKGREADWAGPGLRADWAFKAATCPGSLLWAPTQCMAMSMVSSIQDRLGPRVLCRSASQPGILSKPVSLDKTLARSQKKLGTCPGDLGVGAAPTINPWDYQREKPGRFS